METEFGQLGRAPERAELKREVIGVALRMQYLLLLEGQRLFDHGRRLPLGLIHGFHRKDVGPVDRAQLVFLRAGNIAKRIVNLSRRMHVQQLKRHDFDATVDFVQGALQSLLDVFLDPAAFGGIDCIDASARGDAAQCRQGHAAHQCIRLGDAVGVGHCVLDPVLDSPTQVDQIAVACQQKRLFRPRLFLEPRPGGGAPVDRRIPTRGGVLADRGVRRLRLAARESELDALHLVLAHDAVRFERPRQPVVQSRIERRRDDLSEAGAHADFAGLDSDKAAAHVEYGRYRRGRACQPGRRQPQTGQPREPVPQPEPFRRHRRAPHAEREQNDKQQRARHFERIRKEGGGCAEGRPGIQSPGLVYPVKRKAGQQGDDDDRPEIDRHDSGAEEFREQHHAADVGGGSDQEKHQRRAGVKALHHQRGGHRRGLGRADVDRNADEQHHQHGYQFVIQVALEEYGRQRGRDKRGQHDPQHDPVAGVVQQLAERVTIDPLQGVPCPCTAAFHGRRRRRPGDVIVGVRMDDVRTMRTRRLRIDPGGRKMRAIFRAVRIFSRTEQIGEKTGCNRGHHRRDRTEHGDDRIHQRVGQADRIGAGFRRGDEECHGCPGRGALPPQAQRGRHDTARAQRQRRADRRGPQHRLHLADAEQFREQLFRNAYGQHAGDEKSEKQEDGGLLENVPGLPQQSQKEFGH